MVSLVVIVGGGVLIASAFSKAPGPTPPAIPTAVPTLRPTSAPGTPPPAPPTPAPVPTGSTVTAAPGETPLPTSPPTAAPTPRPTAPPVIPTSAPTAPSGGSTQVDTKYLAVTLPAGWEVVDQKDWLIRARLPGKGELLLVSGPVSSSPTTEGWIQVNLEGDQKTDPNATICAGPEDVTLQNGPPAKGYLICLTVVPQGGGGAYEAYDLFNTAVDEVGSRVYQLEVFTRKESFDEVIGIVRAQISPTIVWKLYQP